MLLIFSEMTPTYSLMPDNWRDLARALVAEMIGTMLLVVIGCGAAVNWKTSFDVTQVRMILILKLKGHISYVTSPSIVI